MFEAYGQTECTAGCTITLPGDWKSGMFFAYWTVGAMAGRTVLDKLGFGCLDSLNTLDECGRY